MDPGLARTGFGVLKWSKSSLQVLNLGIIETSKDESFPRRLFHIHREMKELLIRYQPRHVAIEELFFAKNRKTAMQVSQARGVLILSCIEADKEIFEYTPVQVKQSVSGYGQASKEQVMRVLSLLVEDPEKCIESAIDDATDALAVAICHGNHYKSYDPYSRYMGRRLSL